MIICVKITLVVIVTTNLLLRWLPDFFFWLLKNERFVWNVEKA
jgi:hypothetical protein